MLSSAKLPRDIPINYPKPPIRWAGGKAWLQGTLAPRITRCMEAGKITNYVEPFLGGGAIALAVASLMEDQVVLHLSDICQPLITMWQTIQGHPDELVVELDRLKYKYGYTEEGYYNARFDFNALEKRGYWEEAAYFLYLNSTSYNGLYRTNSVGYYNTPWGKLKRPKQHTLEEFQTVRDLLRRAVIEAGDFEEAIAKSPANSVVFVDSPYLDVFSDYEAAGFGIEDHTRLARTLQGHVDRGGVFIQTINDHPKVRELYRWAKQEATTEPRLIAAKVSGRKAASGLLISAGV